MDEQKRLATLRLYDLLDTAAEDAYDRLTQLAAHVCGMPISLISLVDQDRQWFKSKVGLTTHQTPREHAFCSHAIQGGEVMIVEDAALDQRFATNPLVNSDPNIRFYAGAPLTVRDGASLGTLCVIDTQPRSLTSEQIQSLETIRDAVVALIELRKSAQQIADMEKLLPLCAWCHSIKTTSGDWQPLSEFVEHSGPVTHSICNACLKEQTGSN